MDNFFEIKYCNDGVIIKKNGISFSVEKGQMEIFGLIHQIVILNYLLVIIQEIKMNFKVILFLNI